MKTRQLLLATLGCTLLTSAVHSQTSRTNPRAEVDFYLQTYGSVSPADIPEVYTVFNKVRAAADKSSLGTPQLVVVNDTKQASAFAFSDGTIFLSQRALSIIREGATGEQVQARLAFVLGHELAHLSSNDFWDNQISQALLESSTAREVPGRKPERQLSVLDTSTGQQKKELKADDLGFVYAALAGYDVDELLQPTGANEDFLSFWNTKAGKRNDPNYPEAAQRASLLRLRLAEMRDALHYFEFGSRLMHFGRYREAIAMFREFQKQFPGRELFNNLGYCNLRLAVTQMDPEYAYHYWLPMVSDLDTTLVKLTLRSGEQPLDRKQWRMSAAARDNLLQAVRYFELAIEKDAGYAPSYVNLSVAHLLLGMDAGDTRMQGIDGSHLLRAKIAVESATKLQPDQTTKLLGAIIDSEMTGGEKTTRIPAALSGLESKDAAVSYNLARMTADDPKRASRYWQNVAAQFDALPKKLQALVCQRAKQKPSDVKMPCETFSSALPAQLPWNLPIKLSRDLLETPVADGELRQNGWQKKALATSTALVGAKSSALATDDIVTLVVLKRVSANADTLLQCCSQPLEKIALAHGTLWHYGRWVAFIRDRGIEEIWTVN